ncbi:MAG: adenylate/guanylate cyclase domain-containing protein [Candidatus Omnitrophica bacterium]|nr:adenylate/guanylate cyclase domain-containing protein [Candidatus Omnitrophota bacterium]
MHRTIRKLLEDAVGISEQIIAVNLDIRGFSNFSQQVESPDVAMFVKRVYARLLDKYFSRVSFFKPTGDGLLLTIPYTERNLQEVAREVINTCLKVLKEFGAICANDPVINFEVPKKIGIGISRGTSCRLKSRNKTLDYSGRVLNLASRLMDLARPAGIVFDDSFVISLLSDEQIKLFSKDSVFIKGIADRDPVDIWYTKDLTTISPLNKQPIDKVQWKTDNYKLTLRAIKKLGPIFIYSLEKEPVDHNQIKINVTYPGIIKGRKQKDFVSVIPLQNFEYHLEAGEPEIKVRFDALAKQLEAIGVKEGWSIKLAIIYPR